MIAFSEEELKLLNTIKAHALEYNPPVTPRLAGGFVRDRIMGIECHDIDIAIDIVSGLHFAQNLIRKLDDDNHNIEHSHVHKITANPEKSKHLETAVVNIMGYSIDFVNLRTETYADSRIPEIKTGTPTEDSLRRDITINSLFYNLITGEIEDFTGRGLKDIQNKIIETPIDPQITLLEDPLRILRIFRFSCKLGFQISPRIYSAFTNNGIRKALRSKVSNERIGIEIFKMIGYDRGEDGLIGISQNQLIDETFKPLNFCITEKEHETVFRQLQLSDWKDFTLALNNLLTEMRNKFARMDRKKLNKGILKLYTVLQMFLNTRLGKKNEFLNVLIVKESLKGSKEIFGTIQKIEDAVEWMRENHRVDIDPIEIVVRFKEYWIETLLILESKTRDSTYKNLIEDVFRKNVQECYLEKPLVDGDFLVAEKTPQSEFKEMLLHCFIEQIKNPGIQPSEIYSKVKERIQSKE